MISAELMYEKVMHRMDMTKETKEEELQEIIRTVLEDESKKEFIPLSEKIRLSRELFNAFRRLDILQDLIEDDSITEIMVNGTENIFYEKEGKLYRTNRHFFSESRLCDVIQQIVGEANRYVNETSPIVDARLADGSRVNVVLKPVAVNGPIMTIRKFPSKAIKMNDLIKMGSLTKEAAEFIRKIVRSKYNIFVSGGTGAGKTTFLNAMSDFIPKEERIITIEDNAELQIQGVENLVRLEAREANLEGEGAVTIRDLIKSALRMRPEGIKIKKGKLKRKKKRIPIPHTFLQHILGNLIPLIRGEVVKIIEEADDLLSLFHSVLHIEGILPIYGVYAQHSFPE